MVGNGVCNGSSVWHVITNLLTFRWCVHALSRKVSRTHLSPSCKHRASSHSSVLSLHGRSYLFLRPPGSSIYVCITAQHSTGCMTPCQDVKNAVLQLSTAVSDFERYDLVAELDCVPDSKTFEKEFVARNRPCVIRNAVSHWPAIEKWSLDYISEKMGEQRSTCTFSSNGRADSVQSLPQGDVFLLPDNRKMTIKEFIRLFRNSRLDESPFVPSVQYQNDNMSEFGCLADDFDASFPWAFQAFDSGTPDAVNLWIGDSRSSTTFHKDHYENMYAVVRGQKTFTLRPPSSIAHMHLQSYPVWEQTMQSDFRTFSYHPKLEPSGSSPSRVSWCPVDVDAISAGGTSRAQQEALFPRYFQGPSSLEVVVNAGDLFYLPAMWYHYVRQNELAGEAVIAVNCWVDMRFDARYAYFECMKRICESVGLVDAG